MKNSYDIIKTILSTEKITNQEPQGKYLFLVDTKSNKIEIKKAIEEIYKVKVLTVNTINVIGKLKKVRYHTGYSSAWKKAIVTLKKGQRIELA
jgi:large subunit ribosomal protein L23